MTFGPNLEIPREVDIMFSLTRNPAAAAYCLQESEYDATFPKESFLQPTEEDDPLGSIIIYLCGIIHESNKYEFALLDASGAVVDTMPINCELEILLEQADDLLQAARNESVREFQIDFFEQGYEVLIICRVRGAQIEVSSRDLPALAATLTRKQFDESIRGIVRQWLDAARELCPELVDAPVLVDWLRSVLPAGGK